MGLENTYQVQGNLNRLANSIDQHKRIINGLKKSLHTNSYIHSDLIQQQIKDTEKNLEQARKDLATAEKESGLLGVVTEQIASAPPAYNTEPINEQTLIDQQTVNGQARNIEETKNKLNTLFAQIQQRKAFLNINPNNSNTLGDSSSSNANTITDRQLLNLLQQERLLKEQLAIDQKRLAISEQQLQLLGVYEFSQPTLFESVNVYQPDSMTDIAPAYPSLPTTAYNDKSSLNYAYYSEKTSYGLKYAATVVKHHLTPEEYADKKELTWKKSADYVFSFLVLAAMLAASYEYVASESSEDNYGDTSATLVGCTYGLAGLALAYAFFVGWAMLKDKENEYAAKLARDNGELGAVANQADHVFHMSMRTRWAIAAVFSIVGFAVATALQPKDIEYSAPGLLLAPIAAICIAMAMSHMKNMEAAQKDPKYVRKTYTELFKENFVTIIVAAIGLAVIYNNAVVMNTNYDGDSAARGEAQTNALNLTTRVVGGLFASAGLLMFIQQSISAMLAALDRDKKLSEIANDASEAEAGKTGAKFYYYNDKSKTLSASEENHRKDLGTKVFMEHQPLDKPDRRNTAIMHLVLGLAFYAAYWSLSGETATADDPASFAKKMITVTAAFAATLCFMKAATNTEKHFNKKGTVIFTQEDVPQKSGGADIPMTRMQHIH